MRLPWQAVQAAGGKLPATWLEGVLHRLKHQGPQRVLKHLAWLAARYPSPGVQEKLVYLQKREAHMQYPTYQAAGWPIGSGSVESAGHRWSSKPVSKERACGFRRQHVNPMLVLRNAVCNRRWNETWTTALAHRRVLRTSQRQAESQQRLTSAVWTLVFWGVRLSRLSHPPVHAATPPTTQALVQQPARRPGSGYSWRKPFLRRSPSSPALSGEAGAKK